MRPGRPAFRPSARAPGVALCLGLGAACAASRVPLPDPPRVLDPSELARWSKPPAPAPEVPSRLPLSISRLAFENGMHVTIVARPETLSTTISLNLPSMADPSAGRVTFMGVALRAGTMVSGGEVLMNPGLPGTTISVVTGRTGTTLAWEVLPRASDQGLLILGAFLLRPAFNLPDVAALAHQEVGEIARHSFSVPRMHELVHAAVPGLARPTSRDDAKSLVGMNRDLLLQIHAYTVRPEGAELIVVGPVDPDQVAAWAQTTFGAWRARRRADDPACAAWLGPVAPAHPEQARLERAQLQVVVGDFDPVVIVSVPGPAPESDDYLPFALLGDIIVERRAGTARVVRDMGATYGIHPSLQDEYAHFSLLDLGGQVDPELTRETLRAMVTDIRTLAESLQAVEVTNASRRRRHEIVASLGSNAAIAKLIRLQLRRGHDVRALPELLDEIARIDQDRCRDVARRFFSGAEPSLGVMGLAREVVDGLGLDVDVRYFVWRSGGHF
jgi:predicted Zn-dependent peptidase